MKVRLGVNIDHVATLRQQRRGKTPDPVAAARWCERAGADSIVCHLREDRRHIQDADVARMRQELRTRLNLEMSIAPSVVKVALAAKPDQITLVPERRQELTTEGGLDVARLSGRLKRLLPQFSARRIRVGVFIDPEPRQIKATLALRVPVIELHTGCYAEARSAIARKRELTALRRAAALAKHSGLAVAAGHGLDYRNVGPVAAMPEMEELNIGFSIIARAIEVGISQAVQEMIVSIRDARA